jgi:GTP-binding protein HflX
VVDASHPQAEEQIEAVNRVLHELEADGKPTLMVFNKTDREVGAAVAARLRNQFPNAVCTSARTGSGLQELMSELGVMLRPVRALLRLSIPHVDAAVIARLHAMGQVLESDYSGETARFLAQIPPHLVHEFSRYEVPEETSKATAARRPRKRAGAGTPKP